MRRTFTFLSILVKRYYKRSLQNVSWFIHDGLNYSVPITAVWTILGFFSLVCIYPRTNPPVFAWIIAMLPLVIIAVIVLAAGIVFVFVYIDEFVSKISRVVKKDIEEAWGEAETKTGDKYSLVRGSIDPHDQLVRGSDERLRKL